MLLLTCSECAFLGQDKELRWQVKGSGQERCKERSRQKRDVSIDMFVDERERRGCREGEWRVGQW